MAHRTFKAAAAEANAEPVTFSVEGFDHTFTVKQPLPMGMLLQFTALINPDDPNDPEAGVAMGAGFYKLLSAWVIDEDQAKWEECLGQLSSLDVLGDIITYIVEEVTARPTQAS